MGLSPEYVVRETASNLWRNRLMTLAAVLTVAVSLSLVGSALLLKQGVSQAVGQWKGGVQLLIFMQPTAPLSQINAIGAELKADTAVKSISFVDQAQSYAEFRRYFPNQPALTSVVTPSNLPPSFRIVLNDANEAPAVGGQFANQPGVYSVQFNRKAVDEMLSVTNILQVVIVVVAVVLLLSATVLILNAIRMAIFARRREVAVMKLVGATNWFIRLPFMLEGFIQGLLGALVAVVAVIGLQHLVSYTINHFHAHLFAAAEVTGGQLATTEIIVVLVGVLVGAGGSALAVRRFLEV